MSGLHKDFHGYHSFILQYVQREYGKAFLEEGLRRIGRVVYAPIAERLSKEGLVYFAAYWKEIFELEEARCQIELKDDRLLLTVIECPAVCHIKSKGWSVAPSFCEHTRIVNEEICRKAGYECSVDYDQNKGRCLQTFWKKEQS